MTLKLALASALLCVAACALTGCLAVAATGAVVGAAGTVVGAAAKGTGAVIGAVIPGRHEDR
jgi:hypothetical protein